MSEEQQAEVSVEQLQEQMNVMQAENQRLQQEHAAMLNKNNEMLNELKASKNAQREAEAMAQQEAETKARKAGDFEQLLKSSEEQRHALEEQLNKLNGTISKEKIDNAAMKIAAELAEGHNVEILGDIISRRLKYTDEGLKVTDADGNLTVSSLADLSSEFANSEKYKSLLRGLKSSGGNATGGGSNALKKEPMAIAEFNQLSEREKRSFIQAGGELI